MREWMSGGMNVDEWFEGVREAPFVAQGGWFSPELIRKHVGTAF